MKVALVHDWLVGMRGGEHCLARFLKLFPGADVHTLVYSPDSFSPPISASPVYTSSLGRLPGINKYYRHLLPIYPQVAKGVSRSLRDKNYDLVISISHAWAKNIQVNCPHVCYCLTPMRYIWDHFDTYFANRPVEPLARAIAPYLRRWDQKGAQGVEKFFAISNYISERIDRVYGRKSEIVFPPVEQDWLQVAEKTSGERDSLPDASGEEGAFLVVNALVPYKNTKVIVEAFNQMDRALKIIGTGPELSELRKVARPNIEFLEKVSRDELARTYRRSRALVFAAREDFGMTAVEAQAAGRPVIALGQGGALETVEGGSGSGRTGVFFETPTVKGICGAVEEFIGLESGISQSDCLRNASKFSPEKFDQGILSTLSEIGIEGLGENSRFSDSKSTDPCLSNADQSKEAKAIASAG